MQFFLQTKMTVFCAAAIGRCLFQYCPFNAESAFLLLWIARLNFVYLGFRTRFCDLQNASWRCRSHANIFFGTTLLTNPDFRFVYDAFYLAILLGWTIVGVSAVTVNIGVRCWCCSCLSFGQDIDVMFGYMNEQILNDLSITEKRKRH
jgi:hypothetical protein